MFFHGGAFVLGDRYTEELRCLRYAAEAPCVVVSVDYRLAPEHPYPAAVEDCFAGLEWTVSHGAELDVDPGRVGRRREAAPVALWRPPWPSWRATRAARGSCSSSSTTP